MGMGGQMGGPNNGMGGWGGQMGGMMNPSMAWGGQMGWGGQQQQMQQMQSMGGGQQQQSGNSDMRPGDWTCPGCQNNNFARRFADEHTPPWLPNNSVLYAYFLFLSGTRATDAQAPSQQAFQQLQRTAQVTTSAVFVSHVAHGELTCGVLSWW